MDRICLPFQASNTASIYILGFVLTLAAISTSSANAQAIFSFEDDLQSWESDAGVTLSQTTFGATDGSQALLIEDLTSGYKNGIATTPLFGPSTTGLTDAFEAFETAASVIVEGGSPKLEFDVAWDFSNYVPDENNYIQLGIYVNSSSDPEGGPAGDWHDLGTGAFLTGNIEFDSWPSLGPASVDDGVSLTMTGPNSAHVAIPFAAENEMSIFTPSTFYDIGFQSNGGFGGTVDFALDNFLFTGVPRFEEHTLFSWETPDDPGTPGINEQLEGWMSTQDPPTQTLSIHSEGATAGTSALQLDRTPLQDGFTWGSAFELTSDIDPDPENEVIDPAIQDRIDEFVSRINAAEQLAVDVTFEDQFPISPSFTEVWFAFTDETGAQYQAGSGNFDINNAAPGTTQTLTINIADFDDFNSDMNLAMDGLMEGTNSLGIVLGTSTDDGAIYQLDNLRLISEVVSVDMDNDGDVDGFDFLQLQRENPALISEWKAQYGTGNSGTLLASVPEPLSGCLILSGIGLFVVQRNRRVRLNLHIKWK